MISGRTVYQIVLGVTFWVVALSVDREAGWRFFAVLVALWIANLAGYVEGADREATRQAEGRS